MTRVGDLSAVEALQLELVRIRARIRMTLNNLNNPEGKLAVHYGYTLDHECTFERVAGAAKNDHTGAAFFSVGHLYSRLESVLEDLDGLLPPRTNDGGAQ